MENLSCNNITKTYSNKKVLDNINLVIEPHKIYGLLGRNGVGKTTLLSIMTAQNTCDSGNVTYGNEEVWENQKALDNICFSREINTMTSMGPNNEKIKWYLKTASIYYPNWDKEYAARLIKEFKLDTKKKIYKSSKGMLSMVTIIIALASCAPITILDEPVAGLDVVMRDKFYKLLLEDYERTQRTFIISTHIIEEAANIFEEIIILDKSQILLKQNTQELINSCYYLNGHEDTVDKITAGLDIINSENIGRNKNVCVRLNPNQDINEIVSNSDVYISPVTLEKLFIYLTTEIDDNN